MASLPPAAHAFDTIAGIFDARFSPWRSVAAQRGAVRAVLLDAFPEGTELVEIGGGTGEDAGWLAERGRNVLITDASPAMMRVAAAKLADRPGVATDTVSAEELELFALRRAAQGAQPFDGAWSNFAALNCVTDLVPVARGLARLVRPGGGAVLVLFGTACPGEMLVETLRGHPNKALRRFRRSDVPARLGGRSFTVRYHRKRDIVRAMAPWFALESRQAIGLCVPPSAAEPWISRHPRLLATLERLDRTLAGPLAPLGDHILYRFMRNDVEVARP